MAAGLLTRFRWRTSRDPQLLSDQNTHCPGTPSMPSHGRRRQEHPVTQSLSHCAWCFPISGVAVQQAGGHGGRTQRREYSESSPSASGLARHCTPPRRPGPQPETPGPAARCLELATNGIKIKKKSGVPGFAGRGKPPCTVPVCGARDGGRGGQRGSPFFHSGIATKAALEYQCHWGRKRIQTAGITSGGQSQRQPSSGKPIC